MENFPKLLSECQLLKNCSMELGQLNYEAWRQTCQEEIK